LLHCLQEKDKEMRISIENIEGLTAEELINFVDSQCYNQDNHDLLESQDFLLLPDYVRHLIFILRFDTDYDMQGVFTLLQNSSGRYLYQTIDSFLHTDNAQIAGYLTQIADLLNGHGLMLSHIRMKTEGVVQFDVVSAGNIADNEQLTDEIAKVDEQLQLLMYEKEFWVNVEKKIKEKR
jgi:hypothetical protein